MIDYKSTFWPPDTSDDIHYQHLSSVITNHVNSIRNKINQLETRSYLSDVEKLINSTLLELRGNKNIIIKPADKNLGTCIMTKATYLHYCNEILSDETTYQSLLPPTFETLSFNTNDNQQPHYIQQGFQQLEDILKKHDNLYQEKTYLNNKQKYAPQQSQQPRRLKSKLAQSLLQLQNSAKLQVGAKFYILLKMHKPQISGRPIVNCINTMTYHASKYLSNILNPITRKLPTVVHSSLDSLLIIDGIKLSPTNIHQYTLLSADVKNLYPSIPISYGLKAVRTVLSSFPADFHPGDIDFILDLLAWVLQNNYIEFNNITYLQISGTAMGTPCAPPYANIVLYHLEHNIVNKYQPEVYLRYLDDIFAVFQSTAQAKSFVTEFNQQQENIITLDSVVYGTKDITFLDLQLSIINNNNNYCLDCKLYQKPSNKYLYLPPKSAHKHHVFKNFIVNELLRYRLFNTSSANFLQSKSAFYKRLKDRGYNDNFLLPLFHQPLLSRQSLLLNAQEKRSLTRSTTSLNSYKQQPHHPIVIVNTPKLQHLSIPLHELFELPDSIISHDYYRLAFPHQNPRSTPIIANQLGKSILRLIDVDKFTTPHG